MAKEALWRCRMVGGPGQAQAKRRPRRKRRPPDPLEGRMRVMEYNVGGLRQRETQLAEHVRAHRIDIVLASEAHVKEKGSE